MNDVHAWVLEGDQAEIYEKYLVPSIFAQWAHQVIMIAQVDQGARVLDAGCRTGVLARAAAREAGQFSDITGLDRDESMLVVARRLAPEITWVQGDVQELPFEDQDFDRVLCQFVLMFVKNRVAAIREMWRVLKPGGRLVIVTWDSLEKSAAYSRLLKLIAGIAGPVAARTLYTPWGLGDDNTLISLLRSAGIVEFELLMRKGIVKFPSIDTLVEVEIMASPSMNSMSKLQCSTIKHLAYEGLAQFLLPNGEVTIQRDAKIVTAIKA